jgi:hypothetical protein
MLSFQPVTLATMTPDRDATLVFREGRLLAVLTRLSHIHLDDEGRWFLESAFAEVPVGHPPLFDDLDKARAWLLGEAEPGT